MFGHQHKPIFGSRRMGSCDHEEVAPGVPDIGKDLFTIAQGISGLEKSVENLDKKFEDLSEVRPFIESRVNTSIYDLKDEIKDIFKCLQGSITDRLSSIEAQIKESVIEKKEKEASNKLVRAKQEIEQVKKDTQEKFSKLEHLISGMFETNKDQVKDKVDAGFNQQEVKFKAIEAQVGELKKVIAIAAPSLMTRTRGTTIRFRGRTVPGVTWSLMRPPSWVSAAPVTSLFSHFYV